MSEIALPAPQVKRTIVVHRIVQAGLLLTLIWKYHFFGLASRVYGSLPVQDSFFPDFFQSVWTVRAAFLIAVVATGLNLVTPHHPTRRICSGVSLSAITILCLHQASYNDMTFVTAWWTAVWAMWYVWQLQRTDEQALLHHASLLSRMIISLILLGGAAGKWTAEYWSGDVFYDIYFRDRDYWVFNLLRSSFEPETLREIATWYSRKVVVVETTTGLGLWLLPARWAAIAGIVVLTSIALFSNLYLFSVLATLIGLASVGLWARPWRQRVSRRR